MNNLKMHVFLLIIGLSVAVGALIIPRSADALAVTVKRVVFEGRKRAEVITIINNSDVEKTYRLGWKHFVMSESEGLVAVPKDALPPEIKPSSEMVRFSPRRFTLPSRGSQQVRMMLRMPSGVEDGEYRSHLWIVPEEDIEAYKRRVEKKRGKNSGVSMQMLTGITMPVIVRKGALDMVSSIEGLSASFADNTISVEFAIMRNGEKSSYGDLDFVCNRGGQQYLLKFIRGISVYSELSKRVISLKIPLKEDKPACSTLFLRYTETDGFAGDAIGVLAEAETPVR